MICQAFSACYLNFAIIIAVYDVDFEVLLKYTIKQRKGGVVYERRIFCLYKLFGNNL